MVDKIRKKKPEIIPSLPTTTRYRANSDILMHQVFWRNLHDQPSFKTNAFSMLACYNNVN